MARLRPRLDAVLTEFPARSLTDDTLAAMSAMVRDYKKHPEIIAVASDVIQNAPPKAYATEARFLFEYVRDEIRYQQDVNGVEVVQTPDITLALAHGDCDDMAVLLATLLEATGHPTRFFAAGFNGGDIEHVWVETLIGGRFGNRWFAMDPTEDCEFGWRPPGITVHRIINN